MRLPILEGLLWRSAIKSFAPVPPATVNVNNVLEAIRLSPSSFGVQPYDIHVVTDVDLKAKLREVSYDQPQITECSHLLVFCARNDASECVDRFIKSCELDNSAPKYADSLRESVSPMTPEICLPWATSQAFIGLGMGLAAAAEEGISSCPMGGFVASDVHRVLRLPENQWPVVYMAIGSKVDKPSSRPKYRLKKEDLFHFHHGREMNETPPISSDITTVSSSSDTAGTPP